MADRATDQNRVTYMACHRTIYGSHATIQRIDANGEEIGHCQRVWLVRIADLEAEGMTLIDRGDGTFEDVGGGRYVRKE